VRYKLVLENEQENIFPIDYPYILNSIIEKYSEPYFSSSKYDKTLLMDLFSYSPFLVKEKIIDGDNNRIKLLSKRMYWILSSPVAEHVHCCAKNLFMDKKIEICGNKLNVTGILKINEPVFEDKMKFICLSPISIVKKIINARKNYVYYDYNENVSPIIKNSLENKYRKVFFQDPPKSDLKIKFDHNYINKRNGRVMKLLSVVESDGFARKVKGIFAPFEIEGHLDLIRLGYYTGFGDMTQYGLGIVDIVSNFNS